MLREPFDISIAIVTAQVLVKIRVWQCDTRAIVDSAMAFTGTLQGSSFSTCYSSRFLPAKLTLHNLAGGQTHDCNSALRIGSGSFQGSFKRSQSSLTVSRSRGSLAIYAIKNGETLNRPLKVAVVGGGPGGASTADTLARSGIETYLFERKLDNCKVSPLIPTRAYLS